MGVEPLELLATSAGAVLTVLLMMSGGALVALRGYLPHDSIKAMNKLNLQLLLPCMLFTRVSQSASIEAWTVCWVLPASAVVQLALGFTLSSLFARAARLRPGASRIFRMAGTFGNSQAFPMVVLKLVAEDLLADDPNAADRAMAYVAYYLVCWSIVCWSAGWSFLSAPLPAEEAACEGGVRGAIAGYDGSASGKLEGARDASARGSTPKRTVGAAQSDVELLPVEHCAADFGAPAAAPASLGEWREWDGSAKGEEDGSADGSADLRAQTPHSGGWCARWCGCCNGAACRCVQLLRAVGSSQALSPPVIAVLCGLLVGMTPLRRLFVGSSAPLHLLHRAGLLLGDSVVPLSTLLSGASLVSASGRPGPHPTPGPHGSGSGEAVRARASGCQRARSALFRAELLGVVLVRLLLLPLCSWLLFLAARHGLGLFPRQAEQQQGSSGGLSGAGLVDPLIGFVVLLEGAMPTANNVVRACLCASPPCCVRAVPPLHSRELLLCCASLPPST